MSVMDMVLHRTMTPVMCNSRIATPSDFSFENRDDFRNRPKSAVESNRNFYKQHKTLGMRPQSTMELLSDPHYQHEVRRLSRPYTAMAAQTVSSTFDPYLTSYTHEYYRKNGQEDYGMRPPSHLKLESGPLSSETTYNEEYPSKRTSQNIPLWSGGNNPHPSQAFMVWKYPTKSTDSGNQSIPSLTNDKYDKVMRGKSRSTYQVDYRGLPPGYMPTEYTQTVEGDWKSNIPYTLDSSQRISYQQPNQIDPLKNNTDRFGHSKHDKHRLLVGIAPNASRRQATVVTRTTYDNHYNDTAPSISEAAKLHFPEHSRKIIKGKGPAELAQIYEQLKRKHIPRHAQSPSPSLNGYCDEPPIPTPHGGGAKIPDAHYVLSSDPDLNLN